MRGRRPRKHPCAHRDTQPTHACAQTCARWTMQFKTTGSTQARARTSHRNTAHHARHAARMLTQGATHTDNAARTRIRRCTNRHREKGRSEEKDQQPTLDPASCPCTQDKEIFRTAEVQCTYISNFNVSFKVKLDKARCGRLGRSVRHGAASRTKVKRTRLVRFPTFARPGDVIVFRTLWGCLRFGEPATASQ